jgi:hypothetical protein
MGVRGAGFGFPNWVGPGGRPSRAGERVPVGASRRRRPDAKDPRREGLARERSRSAPKLYLPLLDKSSKESIPFCSAWSLISPTCGETND